MANFSNYFPIPSSGGGGGGLTNTYAAFHVNDGTVAGFPLTVGYTPSTGVYEHPEGGVFLKTGHTLKDQGSTYSNSVITGLAHSERAAPTPNPVVTTDPYSTTIRNASTGYATISIPSKLHYVPTDGLGTIYLTYLQSNNFSNNNFNHQPAILRWEKQADGSFIQGSNLVMQVVSTANHYPSGISYDPVNQLWVGIVYHGGNDAFNPLQIYTASSPDGAWTLRASRLPPLADPNASRASQQYDNYFFDLNNEVTTWTDQGFVYWNLRNRASGHNNSYIMAFNTSTNAITGNNDNTGNTQVVITPRFGPEVRTDGTVYSTRQATGFTSFSDTALTTQTATFSDTTVGLQFGNEWVIIAGKLYNVSDLNDGEGFRLIEWSFSGINIIGDGTARTLTTITGLSGNLAQTVFFKIG
jgi:hypothetical protein